jgi:exonuclease III
MDSLRMLIEEKSFDIFTISETWLSQSILDSEVNISGYTLVRQNRDDQSGGGTAIFVREGIPYLHRKDLSNDDSEICWIEVCRPNCKRQFICSVYKPPTYCCDSLIKELNLSLARVPDNAEIIIWGDFNFDFSATKKDPVYNFKQKFPS